MVGIRNLLVFALLAIAVATPAWANMAPVPQRWQPDSAESASAAPLVVFVDHHQAQTRLVIPKSMLDKSFQPQQLPAATPGQPGSGSLKSRTIFAGATLSLLLVGGGAVTVLVRRRRVRAAVVASAALLAVLGAYASMSVADIPPSPDNGRAFNLAGPYSGKLPSMIALPDSFRGSIVVEPVESGNDVTLIIGRDLAGSFAKIKAPPTTAPAANAAPFGAAPE